MIATNKFEVRQHPIKQEVYVDNGDYYGGKGYVEDVKDWEDGMTMVCIHFPSKGYVWFYVDDDRISITPDTPTVKTILSLRKPRDS